MASPAIGTGTGNIQSNTSGLTSCAINAPTNAATGALLVMAFATSASRTLTATGWTSIASIANSLFTNEVEMFWRTHDGSSSYTVSWSSNIDAVGTIALVTGADTSSPIDVSATYDSGFTAATAQTAPSVTTTVADTLLLNFYSAIGNNTWSPASSQTEVSDVAKGTVFAAELTKLAVASSGATGTKTSTCSSSAQWVSMSVAIKPTPSLIKSIGSVPIASVKKVSGVAIASAKKVAGVANT